MPREAAVFRLEGIDDFVELVVPELQRRGLFRTEYDGRTLRENLGLRRPVSRYTGAHSQQHLDVAK
jgi:alkanesulfonate monooxygenase